MTEQQKNDNNKVKPELLRLPPPKLTRTLSVAREEHQITYSSNINDLPQPPPPLLVRQKTCEDKSVCHLKCKNDELDKKFTCNTVQKKNSELSDELSHKTLSASSDDKHPLRRVLSSFSDTLLQKQDKK